MFEGVSSAEAKVLRNRFTPIFRKKSVKLQIPELDEAMYRRLKSLKNSTASKALIDPQEKSLSALQYKIIDIARPLLFLWENKQADSASREAVRTALNLWGGLFNDVTDRRRANILKQTSPSFTTLLSEPDKFDEEESTSLFGSHFIQEMVKAANDEAALNSIGRMSGPSNRSSNGRSFRGGQHGNYVGNGSTSNFQSRQPGSSIPSQRGAHSSRGFNNQFNNRGRYDVVPFNSLKIEKESEPIVAGRLRNFAGCWGQFTKDPWILEVVSDGLKLDLIERPVQVIEPCNMSFGESQTILCNEEIANLLKKGAVSEVANPVFISSLFVIPKKSGGFRPVINLKGLNQYVTHHHFKMEGLSFLKHLVQPGDWLAKLDLKDAYFTVPMHLSDQELLQFRWQGKVYQFNCLPFGLSSAPWAFTKLLKPLVAFFRERGIRLVIYLDDILILGSSKEKLTEDVGLVRSVLESVGFIVNEEKSSCEPSQNIEFLGLIVDTIAMSLSLPQPKVKSVITSCRKLISLSKPSLREIASVMGNFSWAIPAVPFARAHYRNLQRLYNDRLKHTADLDTKVSLSEDAITDLRWWITHLPSVNGKSLTTAEPSLIICSDASLLGWGAVCNNVTSNGPWSFEDSKRHINELELQAAFNALQAFTHSLKNIAVLLMMDNTTAVAYVNKAGGTRSKEMCKLATEMASWCESKGILLQAAYLPGSLNSIADMESRRSHDASDWQLAKTAFRAISEKWPINIDLFATSWNAQTPKFASWFPQPGASLNDALSFSWVGLKGYAFPPFFLIKNCLSKIRREKSEIILVCPYWPSQPWFPVLLELASSTPAIFRPSENLLLSSLGDPHPLCMKPTFLLTAWKLSGDVSKGKIFRNQLLSYYWQPTGRPHTLLTSPPGALGVIGVWDKVSIPCQLI
jgi:hypothetical protein